MSNYTITEDKKKLYAGIYLLEYLINTPKSISVFLDDNDQDLEPVFEWLMEKSLVEIKDEEKYIPSQKGRELLEKFMARYSEYLSMFDVFCAVDLEAGEFAFAKYFDFDTKTEWKNYLNQDNWEDLRVAVADFKKMDPVEIVFMSFINEKRFGRDSSGWQFDLLLGSVWDDILAICNSALQWQTLGWEDEEGVVDAQDVMVDIITQGTEIILNLHEQEAKLIEEEQERLNQQYDDDDPDDDYYVDRVDMPYYPPNHYYGYRDPFYISPMWIGLLILL